MAAEATAMLAALHATHTHTGAIPDVGQCCLCTQRPLPQAGELHIEDHVYQTDACARRCEAMRTAVQNMPIAVKREVLATNRRFRNITWETLITTIGMTTGEFAFYDKSEPTKKTIKDAERSRRQAEDRARDAAYRGELLPGFLASTSTT